MAPVKASTSQQEMLTQCLLQVAKFRDKQAFETVFDYYAPRIRAYSLAREPGANLLADDLTQEVMIRIWEKAHAYKPDIANINTWVFTLARNCRIDYLRRNGRYVSEIDPMTIFDHLEDESSGPLQSTQQQQLQADIQSGLKKLPKEQAEVLNKIYMEGKNHQETSIELNLPLGTTKSRIRLAMKKLELLIGN